VGNWTVVADGEQSRTHRLPSRRRILLQLGAIALGITVAIVATDLIVARVLAESQAVGDAASRTRLVATAVVQPVVTDGLATGDEAARLAVAEAVAQLDENGAALSGVVRVKVWAADGTIVYSDEPRLIGERFEFDEEELEVLADGGTEAEVSDLGAPENRFETSDGPLLEAYTSVSTPSGAPLLFELYFQYDDVLARADELWRDFGLLSAGSILLLVLLLLPLIGRLLRSLRAAGEERESLLQQALDASDDERRRIAGRLHDGAVQDLVGTTLTLSGAAARASGSTATELADAATVVRGTVGTLRTLLLDIYPPSLEREGLAVALGEMVSAVRNRGIDVALDLEPGLYLSADLDRVVFRVVRECLGNAVRHSGAGRIQISVRTDGDAVEAAVTDDGRGFDPEAALARRADGHFGLQILADTVRDAGGRLRVRSELGGGAAWELRMPKR
jgi:two-component system NarL family sensor kinase